MLFVAQIGIKIRIDRKDVITYSTPERFTVIEVSFEIVVSDRFCYFCISMEDQKKNHAASALFQCSICMCASCSGQCWYMHHSRVLL